MSVCLFAHVFLGHFEIDWDTLGTKFLLGGTRSPSGSPIGTRGRSLGRRQGRSLGRSRGRGVSRSRRRSRSRSRSRGVGERFKPIVDLIDTIKISAPPSRGCQTHQIREVCVHGAPKAHDAAELLFGAPKAPVICNPFVKYAEQQSRSDC